MRLLTTNKAAIASFLLCLLTIDFVTSLRDVRVKIPNAVRRGERAILKCLYDLEGDTLYSVKWYKGRREFYSFTPKETPAMKVFLFQGVKVDRSASNESQLVLDLVNLATTGKYSCEVSADAPSFHTLISAGELEVVEVPAKDPVIAGIHSRYRVGDIVRGNCTSRHSKPAANLTWTINGYETNPSHIRHHKALKDPRDLETAVSNIHFVITPQHFVFGKLKIRCAAHIHDVYWKSTEKSIEEDRHKHNAGNSINLVHTFPDDYFDMEDGNFVDRSDTYMTHIKGDVSSLNANSGTSLLYKNMPILPRLTILALLLYTMQQILQLCQQLFNNETSATIAATTTTTTLTTKRDLTPKGVTAKARATDTRPSSKLAKTMDIQIKKNSNNSNNNNITSYNNKKSYSNSNSNNNNNKNNANHKTNNAIKGQHLSGTSVANLLTTLNAKTTTTTAAAVVAPPATPSTSFVTIAALATTPATATTTTICCILKRLRMKTASKVNQHLQEILFYLCALLMLLLLLLFLLLAALLMLVFVKKQLQIASAGSKEFQMITFIIPTAIYIKKLILPNAKAAATAAATTKICRATTSTILAKIGNAINNKSPQQQQQSEELGQPET